MPQTWQELGKRRIAICDQVRSPEDWKDLWYDAPHAFPFEYGGCWTFCPEYEVADFEAEVGFFADVLCLESYVLQKDFAMFTDPARSIFFAFSPGKPPSSPALRLAFMIKNLPATVAELESRGVPFTEPPHNPSPGSSMLKAAFATPNGVPVVLWSSQD